MLNFLTMFIRVIAEPVDGNVDTFFQTRLPPPPLYFLNL